MTRQNPIKFDSNTIEKLIFNTVTANDLELLNEMAAARCLDPAEFSFDGYLQACRNNWKYNEEVQQKFDREPRSTQQRIVVNEAIIYLAENGAKLTKSFLGHCQDHDLNIVCDNQEFFEKSAIPSTEWSPYFNCKQIKKFIDRCWKQGIEPSPSKEWLDGLLKDEDRQKKRRY